jgi:hypothetical protein
MVETNALAYYLIAFLITTVKSVLLQAAAFGPYKMAKSLSFKSGVCTIKHFTKVICNLS